jgi:F0F1-type ATP synthase assembly protein I
MLIARDMLCGGSVAVLGSAVLVYFTSGEYQAARPDAIVRCFYLGQLTRFSVMVGVFAVIMLAVSDINPVALLAAFFIVQVLPLIAVNLYDRRAFSDQRK